jgi:hypothetical protein
VTFREIVAAIVEEVGGDPERAAGLVRERLETTLGFLYELGDTDIDDPLEGRLKNWFVLSDELGVKFRDRFQRGETNLLDGAFSERLDRRENPSFFAEATAPFGEWVTELEAAVKRVLEEALEKYRQRM